jgi:DNA-3-methyladenine glycosylase I
MNVQHRCGWATSEALAAYHDTEWGVPSYDDRHLFEMLMLEGAQAGLSWSTILNKRAAYRLAFDNFEIDRVAGYDAAKLAALLLDAGIVRNRLKLASAVANAQAVQRICAEYGSFAAFVWSFVDGQPLRTSPRRYNDRPASTPVSDALSKALKGYGCKFVGTTICYAFMQATGLVNDHEKNCPRGDACAALAAGRNSPRRTGRRQ